MSEASPAKEMIEKRIELLLATMASLHVKLHICQSEIANTQGQIASLRWVLVEVLHEQSGI